MTGWRSRRPTPCFLILLSLADTGPREVSLHKALCMQVSANARLLPPALVRVNLPLLPPRNHAQAGSVSHELVRFTLVLRSPTADAAAVAEVAPKLADAAARFVSAVQLVTRPGTCCACYATVVRSGARGVVRALAGALQPLAAVCTVTGSSDGVLTPKMLTAVWGRCADAMLAGAGAVIKACEAVDKLPNSDIAAVKRRLLTVAKLVKTSVGEICDEHGVDPKGLAAAVAVAAAAGVLPTPPSSSWSAAGPSLDTHTSAGGAGSSAVSSPSPSVGTLARSSSGGGSSDGGSSAHSEVSLARMRAGVAGLQHTFHAMKHVITLAEATAAPLAALEVPAADAPALDAAVMTGARARLDSIVAATDRLEDAVIDAAAALNDVCEGEGEGSMSAAADAVIACLHQLRDDAVGEGRAGAGEVTAAAELRGCIAAAVEAWQVCRSGWVASGEGGAGAGARR